MNPAVIPTRYPELGLVKFHARLWRFVDITEPTGDRLPPTVGPHYASKSEAFADLTDYHRRNWESC